MNLNLGSQVIHCKWRSYFLDAGVLPESSSPNILSEVQHLLVHGDRVGQKFIDDRLKYKMYGNWYKYGSNDWTGDIL